MILFGGVYYEIKIRDTYLYRGVWNHQLEGSSVIENDVRPLPSGEPLVLHFRLLSSWGYQALGLHVKIYKTWFNKQKMGFNFNLLTIVWSFHPRLLAPKKNMVKPRDEFARPRIRFVLVLNPWLVRLGALSDQTNVETMGFNQYNCVVYQQEMLSCFSHKQIWKLN